MRWQVKINLKSATTGCAATATMRQIIVNTLNTDIDDDHDRKRESGTDLDVQTSERIKSPSFGML